MSNRKIVLFTLISMILILGLSVVSADDNVDDGADKAMDTSIDSSIKDCVTSQTLAEKTSDKTQSYDNTGIDDTSNSKLKKEDGNLKTSKRIVINNQTYYTYFTNQYLNDRVSDGDVLDFQGKFLGNYSMFINKAVNITSTTKDAYIYLNTTAEDWFGGDDVAAFTITKSGAYTNVSDIHFYNSQIFVKGSHHIIFNNITAIVEESTVGRGVGQTSIRDNSSFVTVENSTFSTKDQWGGCTLVLAWANNCTIRYNKITGIGEVGNLFYLTTFNVEERMPYNDAGQLDYTLINVNNTFENNLLIGPGYAQPMCYAICLSGTNNRIINNTVLNYNGSGINVQAYSFDYDMKTLIANNTLNGSNFFMPNGSTVINNTVTGNFTMGTRSIIENNTFTNIKLVYHNLTLSNTKVENVMVTTERDNITIENCNITGNLTIKGASVAEVPINMTVRNNNIGGYILLNGSKNITITNNTIGRQIIISGKNSLNNNVSIYNNSIINDENYTITVDKKVRGLNISDNYLMTNNLTGNDSIYIYPFYEDYIINNDMKVFKLNESNYQRFFNNDGTLKRYLPDNITLEVTGNIKNKKFIFTDGQVYFTNPKGYNLTGSTVEVKANATVSLNKIKVDRIIYEVTDGSYGRLFNADATVGVDTVGDNVTFVVAGNINNRNFTFVNGTVNFTNPRGYTFTNSTVEVKANSTVSLNKIKVDRIIYELTDGSYARLFNADATPRIDTVGDNVTFVVAGNIHNRNFTFVNGTVNFTNPRNYLFTNSIVEIKSNANVSLDNIKVNRIIYEVTDGSYGRLFNVDATVGVDTVGDNVTFVVAGTIHNRNFTFVNGRVNFTNPRGYTFTNSTVEVKANSTVSLNKIKVDRIIYELTDANYDRLFDDNSIFKLDMIHDNITLVVAGNIHNKGFIFDNGTLNFTNPKNYTFTNSTITINAKANVLLNKINVSLVTYELTDSNYANLFNPDGIAKSDVIRNNISLVLAGNIKNKNFIFNDANVIFNNMRGYTLYNATIDVKSKAHVLLYGLKIKNVNVSGKAIILESKDNSVVNTQIEVTTNTQTGVMLISEDNNKVNGVNITVKSTNTQADVPSIHAIVIESENTGKNIANTLIKDTHIDVAGADKAYGLTLNKTTNTSASNISINISSTNTAYPIYISDSINTEISGKITINATDLSYAAYITQTAPDKTGNITLSGIEANINTNNIKAIDADKVQDITIENSLYMLEGSNITAINLSDATGITINNITVQIKSTDNATILAFVNATNANITNSEFTSNIGEGLLIDRSRDVLVDNNYINVTSEYTVEVANSINANVTNNGLYANKQQGDASIRVTESTASVHDNNILNSIVIISGNLTIYKPSDIIVRVTDLNGNSINYGSILLTVNNTDNDVILEGGKATFTYTPQTMDDVSVVAVYTSPNKLQRSNSTTLEVSRIDTMITLTSRTALVNQEVTVTATVKDVMGNMVKDGIVTFTNDNGTILAICNVSSAQASLNVSYPSVGIYNITGVYSNSNEYKESSANTTVTVDNVNIDINGNLTVFTPGNITVRITNQNNATVTSGTIKVYVNNKLQNATIKNGVATLSYTPQSMDSVNVTAVYTTTDNYSVSTTATLNVSMIATKSSLSSRTVLVNQKVALTASVRDVLGKAVRDGLVSFSDSSGKLWGSVRVVDGQASVNVSYPSVGIYNITAVYSNSSTYKQSTDKSMVTVNRVTINITGSLTVFTPSNITIKLTDQNNSAVSKGSLEVKVNNKKQNITFNKGVATFSYTPQSMDSVNVTAVYTTTDNYSVSRTATLKVSMIAAKMSVSSKNILVNQKVVLTASVRDVLGKAVREGLVSFSDSSGKLWGSVRVVDGQASVNVYYPSVGIYNVTAVYSDSSTYKQATARTTVTVDMVNINITGSLTVFTPSNITVKLTYQNNSTINKGSLEVKVNNKKQNITFKNGVVTVACTPLNTNKVNITATYTTTDNYTVNKTASLNVNKITTKLVVKSNNNAPRVNENIKLTFTLTDANKNPVNAQRITANVNNKKYTLTSDKKGVVTLEYLVNKDDKNVTITANYDGNTSYLASTTNLSLNRTYKLDVQLLTGSFNTKPGDTVKLVAHITDNNLDINGGQLVFKLNGLSLKDAEDNPVIVAIKNGLAIMEYKIPDSLGARVHNLTAVYSSRDYQRVELSTPMTIVKYTTHIDVNPLYTSSDIIRLTAQVVDQNNHALNKQTTMCIKINGKSYTFNTTNGTINYTINQTLKDGYYNMTIISGENGKYLASSVKTLLVKSDKLIKTNYINNTLNVKEVLKSGDTKTGKILSILTGSSTVKVGDRLKLVAHLSEDVVDITGGQLVFKLNGMSLKDENNSTVMVNIRKGLGVLDYKIPDTLAARTHNLTAVYSSKKYGRMELTTVLTTNKLNTHITAEPVFTNKATAYIKAQILDDNNQLINRQTTVVIKIDGKSYSLNNTNGRINFKVPLNITKGLHQVCIIAGENGKYLSSRLNTILLGI